MTEPVEHPPEDIRRRRFLSRAFVVIQTAIGATVAFVMGGTVIGPSLGAKRTSWWPAGTISDLIDGEPTPVTIRRAYSDGYRQTVDRSGAVKSGPPPAPLATLATRIENDQVMVEL
jgi:hypothetical protein